MEGFCFNCTAGLQRMPESAGVCVGTSVSSPSGGVAEHNRRLLQGMNQYRQTFQCSRFCTPGMNDIVRE